MSIGSENLVETQRPTLRTIGPVEQAPTGTRLSDGDRVTDLVAELIGSTGIVPEDRLEDLRARSVATSFSTALVEAGFGTQETVGRALASRHGIPFVDLVEVRPSPDAIALVPLHVLKRVVALPYAIEGDVLRVALADPSNIHSCLLYTSPSPRDRTRSRMPSSA